MSCCLPSHFEPPLLRHGCPAEPFQIIPGKQPRIVSTPEEALAGILKSNQRVFMHGAMATPHELADALPVVAEAENLSNIEMCHIHTTGEGRYMTNPRFK